MTLILKQAIFFCSLRVAFFAHYLSIQGKQKMRARESEQLAKECERFGRF
jgi:hypothetical protein